MVATFFPTSLLHFLVEFERLEVKIGDQINTQVKTV